MSEFPYIHEIVEHLSVERKKKLDNAILGEIKEIIKDNSLDTVIVLDETAIVNALKKQIPKKPKFKKSVKSQTFELRCPNCGAVLQSDSPHCKYCGQALDWSDTE